jgi:hypothetical protein
MCGFVSLSWNIASMSMKLCRTSRYTDPMKNNGTLSWNSSPFTSTKSPTVAVPSRICWDVRYMIPVRPAEKMADWPTLSRLSDSCASRADFWYPFSDASYRCPSYLALLKYWTVS